MAAGLTVVVDYGLCNTDSMLRALEECGATHVERTRDPRVVVRADRIVLPGVGTFAAAMRNLGNWGLVDAMNEASAAHDVPFLGACLGMQIMTTTGSEGSSNGPVGGLGFIEGEVVRLNAGNGKERIPHVGWNDVMPTTRALLFEGLRPSADFYFVHSYHVRLRRDEEVGRTEYGGGFTAAIQAENQPIFGVQFHPEKSQKNGFRLLRNFLAI